MPQSKLGASLLMFLRSEEGKSLIAEAVREFMSFESLPKALKEIDYAHLDIPDYLLQNLVQNGVKRIDDLRALSKEGLDRLPNFGKKSAEHVKRALIKYDQFGIRPRRKYWT